MTTLQTRAPKRPTDTLLNILVWLCALVTVLSLAGILAYILIKGLPSISWSFLTDLYQPGLEREGVLPMIVSTLLLVAASLVVAAPVGILAAIYLAEYAKPGKLLEFIRFATESLSGIPSIIYGLFGFALFVTLFGLKYSILSGALTLALMVLPTLIRTTEEALRAVPQSYREGSLALGAGRLTTILRVVLPEAIGGILTSIILSIGRVVGETAAIIYTMGSAVAMPTGLLSQGRTLSVHLYFLAKEGTSADQSYATAAVLLILVALINQLASGLAKRFRRKSDDAR